MEENKRLYRIRKFNDMWLTNDELEKKHNRKIYNFINISGRLGGKTFNMRDLVVLGALNNPEFDIVILRANSSQLKQSVYMELKKLFFQILPLDKFIKITFRESPPLMITLPAGNQILFGGVGMGSKSGSNQSRGKTAERRLKYIIVEETQEIFSGNSDGEELLKQSIATYVRFLDEKDGKIIYLGNRERNLNAKFNIWVREKERDETFLILETNWHDIEPLLNQPTITMILQERELNPNNYKYMFLGIPVGGTDLVYGAFSETTHVLSKEITEKIFSDENLGDIVQLYIGVDSASTRDKTVFSPIFQFRNAKLVLRTKEIIYHDPIKNGRLENAPLVRLYIVKWIKELIEKYNLYKKPIRFVVDGHSTDLIGMLQYELRPFSNIAIIKFTKKDLVETSKMVNNAFVEKRFFITEENWTELLSNDEIHISTLINELETVCWREDDSTKFNDAIPNDMTDSIRYPISWHFTPYQLKDFSKKGGD